MTAKQYKKFCRIRVTRYAKFITWCTLVIFFCLAELFNVSGYVTAIIGTTIWFYMPDLATYVLEHIHKLKHDYVSYR
jgi:hypothetical protein